MQPAIYPTDTTSKLSVGKTVGFMGRKGILQVVKADYLWGGNKGKKKGTKTGEIESWTCWMPERDQKVVDFGILYMHFQANVATCSCFLMGGLNLIEVVFTVLASEESRIPWDSGTAASKEEKDH